ncbi:hypothetical protein M8I34_02210 [Streptomyces sp. MCA2]|uniref:hypothetical protein n=1 Tax=Streptomyces sp. MCA2 TaxID=2944805 RepID=UPI00202077D1|nr:hypothetical protein [Streptomyces sp. MCA2]MCL7490282.1 hypothetical protein [Streptomyces sp. MCA2]
MSRTELERLARIRMQVTGETLERAMAALEGRTTAPGPQSEPQADPDPDAGSAPTGNGEANAVDVVDVDSAHGESNEGGENATMPDGRRTPKRRNHLRGL